MLIPIWYVVGCHHHSFENNHCLMLLEGFIVYAVTQGLKILRKARKS